MKKIFFFVAFALIFSVNIFSQVIYLANGDSISLRLEDINLDSVYPTIDQSFVNSDTNISELSVVIANVILSDSSETGITVYGTVDTNDVFIPNFVWLNISNETANSFPDDQFASRLNTRNQKNISIFLKDASFYNSMNTLFQKLRDENSNWNITVEETVEEGGYVSNFLTVQNSGNLTMSLENIRNYHKPKSALLCEKKKEVADNVEIFSKDSVVQDEKPKQKKEKKNDNFVSKKESKKDSNVSKDSIHTKIQKKEQYKFAFSKTYKKHNSSIPQKPTKKDEQKFMLEATLPKNELNIFRKGERIKERN